MFQLMHFNLLGNKISQCSELKSIAVAKFNEGSDFNIKLDTIDFFVSESLDSLWENEKFLISAFPSTIIFFKTFFLRMSYICYGSRMGEASVNSSILKVFLSIDHNETDYQTKKKLNSSKL